MVIAKQHLEKNLFLLHPILRNSLLQIRADCVDIMLNKRLIRVEQSKSYNLDEFMTQQNEFIQDFNQSVLKKWENGIRRNVEQAGRDCMAEKGFEIKSCPPTPENTEHEVEKKLSFTEQAARRTECRRLQRFIKLVDYNIVNVLHILTIESVSDLLRFIYNGCRDEDVIFGHTASGKSDDEVMRESDLLETDEEVDEKSDPSVPKIDASYMVDGLQLGGIIIGPKVGTKELAAHNGYDMFPFILSKIAKEHQPKLDLIEIIDEEGPLNEGYALDEDDDIAPANIPSAELLKTGKQPVAIKEPTFIPLFQTELLLEYEKSSNNLLLAPSLNDFISMVDNLLKTYIGVVEGIPLLTNTIPYLDPTRHGDSATRGLEESDFREGPNISSIIVEGAFFREICGRIRGTLLGIFINSSNWMNQWENVRNTWIENQSFVGLDELKKAAGGLATYLATATPEEQEAGVTQLLINFYRKQIQEARLASEKAKAEVEESNVENIRTSVTKKSSKPETAAVSEPPAPIDEAIEDLTASQILEFAFPIEINSSGDKYSPLVKFFETALSNFSGQLQQLTVIPESKVIGNILLKTEKFKNVLLPSPQRCFEEVSQFLPGLAKSKNELLLAQIQNWVRLLQLPPQNVNDFVQFLGRFDTGKKINCLSNFFLLYSSKIIGFNTRIQQ